MMSIAHAGRCPFERMVLTAPMLGVDLRYPRAVHMTAEILDTYVAYGHRVPATFGDDLLLVHAKLTLTRSDRELVVHPHDEYPELPWLYSPSDVERVLKSVPYDERPGFLRLALEQTSLISEALEAELRTYES